MAVRFDAVGEHYTRSVPGASVWSACFWYYAVSPKGGPFAYGATNAAGPTVFLAGGSTLKAFDLGPNGGGFGSLAVTSGVWYRIAIAVNGSTCTWYHGTETGSLTSASVTNIQSPTGGTQQWSIGYDSFDADTIDGRLANTKIWVGVERTEAEFITELATTEAINTTGLVQRHPFTVAETTDYSGNNNTLSGGIGATTEDGPPINPPTSGVLAASLPAATASVTGEAVSTGGLVGTLPVLVTGLAAMVTNPGSVTMGIPVLGVGAAGQVTSSGALVVGVPAAAANLAGALTVLVVMGVTLPGVVAALTDTEVPAAGLMRPLLRRSPSMVTADRVRR